MTEEQIIEGLNRGDEKAMKEVFRLHKNALLFFGWKYMPWDGMVEEIVSDTFIKLWDRRKNFENLSKIRSFLWRTVKNACINAIIEDERHEKHHKEIFELSDRSYEMDSNLIRAELLSKIYEEAKKLPDARRKIFEMSFKDGFSVEQIADILNISRDTVRVQKARAINWLKAKYPTFQ